MSAVSASVAAAPRRRRRRPSRGMVLALVLATVVAAGVAFAAVTLTRDAAVPALPPAGTPALLTADALSAIAAETGHAVYGVAAPAGTRPEVTRGSNGEVWVRYLGPGAKLGDPRADYLTVGTYRRADALAAAQAAAEGDRSRSAELADGGLMLWNLDRPESVYAAGPGSDLLVEVYSPDPEQARELVRGGAVAPLR